MKRGDQAREAVKNKIVKAFGEDFVCIQDKKIIVQAREGVESIQFAITMTMPKTAVQPISGTDSTNPASNTPTNMSDEDQKAVAELMKKLAIKPGER